MEETFDDKAANLATQGSAELSTSSKRGLTVAHTLELLAAFAVGAAVMSFVYVDTRGISSQVNSLPGYDSWYHTKMAALLPEIGLVDDFPWLKFVYFKREGHDFVSHHTGFHALLTPLVHLAKRWTGDYAPGARWTMSICFGLVLMLIHSLLIQAGIRWRWFWLSLFLFAGSDFFLRHSYVRAICPSLVFMLAILLLLFRGRFVWAGIAVAAYNHLYLGGVIYSPLLVGCFVAAHLLQPAVRRSWQWKAVLWTGLGWAVGILTYPYRDGMFEFLYMQLFETGLSPDIEVGNEWQSYGDVWLFFSEQLGVILGVWTLALVLRLSSDRRTTPKDLTLLILCIVFCVLTFKAKRFIEYSPVFCLLSAAYLAGPVLSRWAAWFDELEDDGNSRAWMPRTGAILFFAIVSVFLASRHGFGNDIEMLLVEWPLITLLVLMLVLPAVLAVWVRHPETLGGSTAFTLALVSIPLSGAVIKAFLQMLFQWSYDVPAGMSQNLPVGYTLTIVLTVLYVSAIVAVVLAARARASAGAVFGRVVRNANVLIASIGIVAAVVTFAGPGLVRAQEQSWCGYDLDEIRQAMAALKGVSQEGDVIFTDDWDVFPVFFYHNSHNHYIVGLDPKFTQSRRPKLWERFVRITRGQAPTRSEVRVRDEFGAVTTREVDVRLEDIRDHFGAKFVITDRDHRTLSQQLMRRRDLAKLIYPTGAEAPGGHSLYVFKILDRGTSRPSTN